MSIINIIIIILSIIVIDVIKNLSPVNKNAYNTKNQYSKKKIMTDCELNFYYKIKELENELDIKIIPQLNLASIIKKENKSRYQTELFRNIDFAIFNNDFSEVLLLIELNDKTHNTNSRKKRDQSVIEICKNANLKLIFFYTKYPNEKEYVKNRIISEIKDQLV